DLRQSRQSWRLAGVQASLHLAELGDADSDRAAVRTVRPEWVFHLAAHGAYSSQTNFEQMVRTNVTRTINLVEACLDTGFESFVNTGSSSEYGFQDRAPSETDPIRPNSHYALTKAAATPYCGLAAIQQAVRMPRAR